MSILVIQSSEDHIDAYIVKDVPERIVQFVNKRRETAPLVFDEDDEFGAWFHDESTPRAQSVVSTSRYSYPPLEYAISVDFVVILRLIT